MYKSMFLLHDNTSNYLTVCKQILIVNRIIRMIKYLKPFNCVKKNELKLVEKFF